VLLAGSEVDDVSGAYIDGWFALSLRQPFSGDYVEDLAFGVRVPQLVRVPGSKNTRKIPASGGESTGSPPIHTAPVNHSSGARRVSTSRVETNFKTASFRPVGSWAFRRVGSFYMVG
jgi:hypothetical protein